MDELLADFLSDAADSLETIEADLLRLESRPGDSGVINAMLRQMHTVKGACGFLNLTRLSVLAETAEAYLSAARGAPIMPPGADAMLRCVDRIKGVIAGLNATGLEPQGDDSALLAEMIAAIAGSTRVPSPLDVEPAAPASIRVAAAALDSLSELAADLMRARAALLHTLDIPGGEQMRPPLLALAKTAGDMAALADHLRRRPAREAWRPLPRLVREACTALGKQVELVLEGEDVEIDSYIVDGMKSALMHLARNAVAHGVERPRERLAVGKTAHGTLRIAARRESNAIVFEVADDGAGLDPATIRRRGIENGMISAAQAARLNDRETLDLLFSPGFSTAPHVNALAGRGIGLDAVRAAVERLGARLDVDAPAGAGATFRIRIPTPAPASAPSADPVLERLSPQLAAAGYEIAATAALDDAPRTPVLKEQSA
jgi:two-component system chemotaxis sensor kinase CheA